MGRNEKRRVETGIKREKRQEEKRTEKKNRKVTEC